MSHPVKLQRLCRKGDAAELLRAFLAERDEPLFVLDESGAAIVGEAGDAPRFPILAEGEQPIGWTGGGPSAQLLASLLAYAARKEIESKSLAQETLSKYKELTLLYELGEKIAACLDTQELVWLALEEAERLLPKKRIRVEIFLCGDDADELLHCSAKGAPLLPAPALERLDGVTRKTLLGGPSEIVNELRGRPREFPLSDELPDAEALICVPLRTQNQTFGVLRAVALEALAFSAGESKVLNLLASQTAVALGRARLIRLHVEQERLQESLELSRKIQMDMLSTDFPRFSDACPVDLYAVMQPAREVAGDFYDYFFLDERTLLLAIGDVSDKGVPAALFMVKVKTLIRAIAKQVRSPQKILEALNPELCRDNDTAMFVTLFVATLHLERGELVYCFGGHNRPLLLARDGRIGPLQGPSGMALGVMEEAGFAERRIALAPGDGLLLYTDGISEALDRDGNLFGEARLSDLLAGRSADNAQDLVERVCGAAGEHSAGAEQADDITVLAVRLAAP